MRSTAIRAHPLVFGVVVFLASESMLFAGLLAAWYDLRGSAPHWPPAGVDLNILSASFGTFLLGLGSVTMAIAQVAVARNKRALARGMLILTLFCALAFVYDTLNEWTHANFWVNSGAYGTLFYVITGTHLAHVAAGAILLAALALFLRRPAFTRDRQAGVEAIAYYWHFVFVVWLAIFATIFLLR